MDDFEVDMIDKLKREVLQLKNKNIELNEKIAVIMGTNKLLLTIIEIRDSELKLIKNY
jgi:hypothetical protein